MDIELHIEELVLHGFPAGDRRQIAAEVERELGRLLEQTGASASGKSVSLDRLSGGAIHVIPGKSIGEQIARSVFKSVQPHVGRPAVRGGKG